MPPSSQSYNDDDDLVLYRRSHPINRASRRERAAPYRYSETSRPSSLAGVEYSPGQAYVQAQIIHDLEPEQRTLQRAGHLHEVQQGYETTQPQDQTIRRRIAVACKRCRKRKIKCSGDPGDYSGCDACKNAGPAERRSCRFMRVNSESVLDVYARRNTGTITSQSLSAQVEPISSDDYYFSVYQPSARGSRPTLPVLHTRSAYPQEHDPYDSSPYETSPTDNYDQPPSAALPRQDYCSPTYGAANYRSWTNTTGTSGAPVATTSYEPPISLTTSGYEPSLLANSFVPVQPMSLLYSQHQESSGPRLPSVASETYSSLNMGHLHHSLPSTTSTVQDRRLPMPANFYTPYTSAETSTFRPLGSFSSRTPSISGFHNFTPVLRLQDILHSTSRSYSPIPSTYPATSASSSLLGYQIPSMPAPESPHIHPATVPSLSESCTGASDSSTGMALWTRCPTSCNSTSLSNGLYPFSDGDDQSQSMYYTASTSMAYPSIMPTNGARASHNPEQPVTAASLFTSSRGDPDHSPTEQRDHNAYTGSSDYTPQLRQPQPYYAARVDSLEHARATPDHRMSILSLDTQHPTQ